METAGRLYQEVKQFGKDWVQTHKDMLNKAPKPNSKSPNPHPRSSCSTQAKELKAYAENSEARRDEMLIEADKAGPPHPPQNPKRL